MLDGYTFIGGDSGAPVFDPNGNFIGMINGQAAPPYDYLGFGTNGSTIQTTLNFDRWYGTQTVYDQTIGIFRPSTQQWILDNGNNRLDACGTDLRYYDTCLGPFGLSTDVPVTGRWNSTARKIGVYRNGTWLLDFSGDGLWGIGDVQYGPLLPYQASDLPVVGSWGNPNNGYSKIGIFRNGTWYVDYNGNGVWDGCTTDRYWTFMAYQAGDKPVVIGRVDSYGEKIGVFRNGTWYIDYNGSHVWDTVDVTVAFGAAGDTPLGGDWSGLGWGAIGINRVETYGGQQYNTWTLDGNGYYDYNGCYTDRCFSFGVPGDKPVVWNNSTVKAN